MNITWSRFLTWLFIGSFVFPCQAIVVNPVDIMCNCHGSHVLRSLLCLFKGVPLEEFHSTKSSVGLAERLNLKAPHAKNVSLQPVQIFPSLLKKFVSEMLNTASEDISKLQMNQYSSLVLQVYNFYPSFHSYVNHFACSI